MGHATLLDVFNQGARFVSNIADTYSRERHAEAVARLQNRKLALVQDSQKFLDDLDLEGDADFYLEKWAKFKTDYEDKAAKEAAGIETSRFYRQEWDTAFRENEVRTEAAVRQKQMDRVHEVTRATTLDSLGRVKDMNKSNPQGMINDANAILDTAVRNRVISYGEGLDMKNYYWEEATGGYIDGKVREAIATGKIKSKGDIYNFINEDINLDHITDSWINPLRGDGTKEGYDDTARDLMRKRDIAREAGKPRALEIWNIEVEAKREETDNNFSKLFTEMTLAGPGEWNGRAKNALLELSAVRDPFIAPKDREHWTNVFGKIEKDTANGNMRAAGKKAIEDMFEKNMYEYIQAGLRGKFSDEGGIISMRDAYEMFQEKCGEELKTIYREHFGEEYNTKNIIADYGKYIHPFFEKAKNAVKGPDGNADSEIYATITALQKFVESDIEQDKPGHLGSRYAAEEETRLKGEVTDYAWKLIFSGDMSRMSGKQIYDRAREFLAAKTGERLAILRADPRTGEFKLTAEGTEKTDDVISRLVYAMDHPDAIWLDVQGREHYAMDTDAGLGEGRQLLAERLAGELKIDKSQITFSKYTERPKEKDRDATMEFIAGKDVYRFRADDEKSYRIEKKTGSGPDDWTPVGGKKIDAQNAAALEREKAATEAEISTAIKMAGDDPPPGISGIQWKYMPEQARQRAINELMDSGKYESWKESLYDNPPPVVKMSKTEWLKKDADERKRIWDSYNRYAGGGRR
jgi:hypothetical protein